jgi:cytidylate kinase
MKGKSSIAIAISRQMGSGGSYIGYVAAKEFSFKYANPEILRKAAERLHIGTALPEDYENRSASLFEKYLRLYSSGMPENAYSQIMKPPLYEKDLFDVECAIVKEIIDRHDAVIVGRAGFCIPRDRPGVIRVFVYASPEFRISRVAQAQHLIVSEARAKVEQADKMQTRFVREILRVEWTDARNYDLCIDAPAVGLSEALEMIRRLICGRQRTMPGPSSCD